MDTESTQDYRDLYEQHLASELTANTAKILSTLSEAPNRVPHIIVQNAVEAGFGVSLEENTGNPAELLAQFLDSSNKQHGNIVLSIAEVEELTRKQFGVDRGTFVNLKSLVLDPDVCNQNVKTRLEHAI